MDKFLVPNSNFIRLVNDWETYGSITVGFDFDDTVYDYHHTGGVYEQVVRLLVELKSIGCKLICWTANNDLNFVKEFLTKNDIPFDGINEGGIPLPWESRKPFFSALLDDRAGLESAYRDLSLLVWYVRKHLKKKS